MIAAVAKRLGFTDESCGQIALAVDEALCNVIKHGYARDPSRPIWIALYAMLFFTFELRHARGETDDATWTWIPELKALHPGDLFIWAVPNAGNPQKVQRYLSDWATALREMAALEPELLPAGAAVYDLTYRATALLRAASQRGLDFMAKMGMKGIMGGGAAIGGASERVAKAWQETLARHGRETELGGDLIDKVYGGDGADTLIGGEGKDTIWGENGDDTITGGNGDDYILGDLGNDTIDGASSMISL